MQLIGDLLPLAVGVAISPVPIIATILMLMSPRAKASSLGFLLGWVAGITVAVVAFTALGSLLPTEQSDGSKPVAGIVGLALGALLLAFGIKQWRSAPADGEEPTLPKWMSAIDTMSPGKATGLAFALAALNPKNLLLAASAGLVVSKSTDGTTVAIVVFIVFASLTVAAPVIGYLVAPRQMAGMLESLRVWLVNHNAAIMSVLMVVLGVSMIGKGLGHF